MKLSSFPLKGESGQNYGKNVKTLKENSHNYFKTKGLSAYLVDLDKLSHRKFGYISATKYPWFTVFGNSVKR